jgi:hypothetical protein
MNAVEQIVGRERREPLDCGMRISDCGFEFAPPRQLNRWGTYSNQLLGFKNFKDLHNRGNQRFNGHRSGVPDNVVHCEENSRSNGLHHRRKVGGDANES